MPTPIQPVAQKSTAFAEDPQRKLLQQLATLSVQAARDEARIEQEYAEAMKTHRDHISQAQQRNEQKRTKNLDAINTRHQDLVARIEENFTKETAALQAATAKARKSAEEEKANTAEAVKKQVEQARWLAESVLEAIETQLDVEARQAKAQQATRLAEIEQQKNARSSLLLRMEQQPIPFEPLSGEDITRRLAEEPDTLYDQEQQAISDGLNKLANLSLPRLVSGATPYLGSIAISAVAAILVQFAFTDTGDKVAAAVITAVVAGVICAIAALQLNRAARNQVIAACVPLSQAIDLAERAADASYTNGENHRTNKERQERVRCAREVDNAREKGKPILSNSAEKLRATRADLDARFNATTEQITKKRDDRLAEAEENHRAALEAAEHAHSHELGRVNAEDQEKGNAIQKKHDDQSRELMGRWNTGLAQIGKLLADTDNPPPAPLDWNSPDWANWQGATVFPHSVPFGSLKVDLRALTEQTPRNLAIPEPFTIPAVLAFPQRGSVLIETDHPGRPHAISIASMVMARLLTHVPGGRVKFTIIDPVGLGQSFAGFMHLADHDESLVGGRIWTETEHIEQRLADLTEHMETVIQKYLRNEYQTIDQYNDQAGELAEPMRVLVIADFPVGFEQESLRRLASIATSGARCGVYMIIIRDTRQQLPAGSHYEELVSRSIFLRLKEGQTAWIDEVFSKFPLTLDPPPDEKTLTTLMDLVGRAARRAKRVEVPFDTIAPKPDEFWTGSSRDELRVSIGKSGATRLQPLRLGTGVAQHALVAGKTGSGKSNLMHTIVTNIAMWYSPEEVEFYLVDFKKGVEFKAYVTQQLPHARAIAVESDREFGLSVLQRVDAELTRRGEMFRNAGVQDISAYRQQTGERLPRTLLLIDEFQEFFSEDDKLAQEAALLMDRLVRQGRAFGVHVVLGSQTIGGSSGLARSTIGQMAVRIALQCSETDSQLILGDNNSAARLLSRPGEAIYNDAGGLVEANSPFQIAFLPDDQRERYLQRVDEKTRATLPTRPFVPVVFEGNAAADITKNDRLREVLAAKPAPGVPHAITTWVGEPVSIKDPTSITIRRQSGANVLLIGQQEELSLAVSAAMMISLSAQHAPGMARFVVMDGTPHDSPLAGTFERTAAILPHTTQMVSYRDVDDTIAALSEELTKRDADADALHESVYVFIYAIQRFRSLRKQEESFSFSNSEEEKPKVDKLFARLLTEGPALGVHVITWADTAVTLDRTFDRGMLREFDNRILFQMSATDSSNLIDSPLANRLGAFRALAYSEEMGTVEKFRPYALPSDDWLEFVSKAIQQRS